MPLDALDPMAAFRLLLWIAIMHADDAASSAVNAVAFLPCLRLAGASSGYIEFAAACSSCD